MDSFKALLITRDEASKKQSVAVASLTPADLMDGDVDVRVEYSTINYKDGLAITGKLPVVRRFPMIPGVDFSGTVTASANPEFKPGDRVILNGWGLGESHHGAFAGMARVKGDWLIPLPSEFTTADAMAIGTAGYTAMLAIMALERNGTVLVEAPVVVTGAVGGVGSMAVALLSGRGAQVSAVTGRASEADYLTALGASAIVDRAELSGAAKLLAKERWIAGIDAVGGAVLANVLSMIGYGGTVAACGNASGMELPTSVAPFILRAVTLVGIDLSRAPKSLRMAAWGRLTRELDRAKLAAMTTTIGFDDILDAARQVVEGKLRGRTVVKIA